MLEVRVNENLSSESAKEGNAFTGTLNKSIVVNGRTVYPKGSEVKGKVVSAKPSGRLKGPGELELALTEIRYGRQSSTVTVEPFMIKGESHAKSNVTKIGGGALAGAIIGGMAGGGKGAAIGAGVGAAAGTGVAAATGKKPATVESEALLGFVTAAPASSAVMPAKAEQPAPSTATRSYEERDSRFSRDEIEEAAYIFSARDRRVIRACFRDRHSDLPPGLAKKDRLPPGLEKQMQRNGKLPPGLQKRVSPLPGICERDLPPLPREIERVIYGRRILLIDAANTILDLFDLDE